MNIRPMHPSDSLEDLTALLHAAYASLAAQGWNFTAVDQPVDVTRERLVGAEVDVVQWHGKTYRSVLMCKPLTAAATPPPTTTP